MLVEPFERSIFPLLVEVGKILAVYSLCKLGYKHFRSPNYKDLVDGLWGAFIAYAIIRGSMVLLDLADSVIENIH